MQITFQKKKKRQYLCALNNLTVIISLETMWLGQHTAVLQCQCKSSFVFSPLSFQG